jgi:hypothetical protein
VPPELGREVREVKERGGGKRGERRGKEGRGEGNRGERRGK